MHRHDRCAGGRDAAQRRAKRDALRAGKLAEQIAGMQAGVLDRQLGQLAASSAVGDTPHHGSLVAALERDAAGRQRPRRRRLEASLVQWRQRRRIDAAAAPPRQVNAVESDRERADARIVGSLRRLGRLDLGKPRQRGIVDQEAAVDLADAAVLEAHRQAEQIGQVEKRIAAAAQDQIAVEHASRQRAPRQQLGAEAVLGSEHVERGHGGRELGGRGRDQGQIRIKLGQYLAGFQIDQQIADRGAGRARRHHRGGGAPVGRGHVRRRHRRFGHALEVAEDLIDRAVRSARDDRRQAVRLAAFNRGGERGDLVASLERNHVVGCGRRGGRPALCATGPADGAWDAVTGGASAPFAHAPSRSRVASAQRIKPWHSRIEAAPLRSLVYRHYACFRRGAEDHVSYGTLVWKPYDAATEYLVACRPRSTPLCPGTGSSGDAIVGGFGRRPGGQTAGEGSQALRCRLLRVARATGCALGARHFRALDLDHWSRRWRRGAGRKEQAVEHRERYRRVLLKFLPQRRRRLQRDVTPRLRQMLDEQLATLRAEIRDDTTPPCTTRCPVACPYTLDQITGDWRP